MLPSTNKVCRRLKQQFLCFKLEALNLQKKPTWQDSRQINAIHRSPKPAWKHTNIAKPISNGIWNKPHCLNGQHWIWKEKLILSKGKNGYEIVEESLLPQIHMEMMEPKVGLVYIKLDFAISFTDLGTKISVHDSFRYRAKIFHHLLFFFCVNLDSRLG